jgi:ABC-type multidrug transport system ATPase subunit
MIKVENLVKAFGPKLAVNGVSFTVERGEVLGFLGPNGAGKSTTMRMVTGFIPPTAGRVTVGGHDMLEHPIPAKRLIGYLPENAPAYTDMTVHGFLSFAACAATPSSEPCIAPLKCAFSKASSTRAWTRCPRATATGHASRSRSSMTRRC